MSHLLYAVPQIFIRTFDENGLITETTTVQEEAFTWEDEDIMDVDLELINSNPANGQSFIGHVPPPKKH